MKWQNRNEKRLDPKGRFRNEPKRLKALMRARAALFPNNPPEGKSFWDCIYKGIYPKGYNRILDKFEKEQKRKKR